MKIAIWGAGITGRTILEDIKKEYSNHKDTEIVFIDSDPKKNKTLFASHMVFHHTWLITNKVDILFIGTYTGYKEIINTIEVQKYDIRRIDSSYVELQYKARIAFLETLKPLLSSVNGCVAELGVYRGEFARYINHYFPNRLLFLYDTFNGFSKKDINIEKSISNANQKFMEGQLNDTSIELVMSKMSNPENVKIIRGRFPDSFHEKDLTFAFVNVDMDLYEPTKKAIINFFPLLSTNGVILVHDYFNKDCPTIMNAVNDAEKELNCSFLKIPIGDKMSLAILKN